MGGLIRDVSVWIDCVLRGAQPAALWIQLYSLRIKTQQRFIRLIIPLAPRRRLAQVSRDENKKMLPKNMSEPKDAVERSWTQTTALLLIYGSAAEDNDTLHRLHTRTYVRVSE